MENQPKLPNTFPKPHQQNQNKNKRTIWIIIIVFSLLVLMAINNLIKEQAIHKDQKRTPDSSNSSKKSINPTPASLSADSINQDGTKNAPEVSKADREEAIQKQFNSWDGSHIKLVFYVKDNMNDPDSFEHISTSYWDKGSFLVVSMKYRGNNKFGAKVINYIKAKVDLEGNILEIIDTGD
jgi:cytoskeletal protein RodZ